MKKTDRPIVKKRRERLLEWISLHHNGKQSEFIRKTGINQGELSALLKDKSFGETKARSIEKDAGMPDMWLDGMGYPDSTKNSHEIMESNADYAIKLGLVRRVPIVGTAQLGDNGYWVEMEYPVGHGDGYLYYPTKDQNAYALRCQGDSMRPRIQDGEFVIIEPDHHPEAGDEVMIKDLNGRVMVKRLLYIRNGKVHLQSINEAHPSHSIPLEEIDKMHYVAGIMKAAMRQIDD